MKVQPFELAKKGGEWLAAVRKYLQSHIKGGDTVCWGSSTILSITAKQVEEMASYIAAAAINEHHETPSPIQFATVPVVIGTAIGGLKLPRQAYEQLRTLIPDHPKIKEYDEYIKERYEESKEWLGEIANIDGVMECFLDSFVYLPEIERTNNALLRITSLIPGAKVVVLPPNVEWYIHQDEDGTETVHEKHRVWS